jgi:hypothetical protein
MSCKMLDQIENVLVVVFRRVVIDVVLIGCLAAGCLALLLISGAYAEDEPQGPSDQPWFKHFQKYILPQDKFLEKLHLDKLGKDNIAAIRSDLITTKDSEEDPVLQAIGQQAQEHQIDEDPVKWIHRVFGDPHFKTWLYRHLKETPGYLGDNNWRELVDTTVIVERPQIDLDKLEKDCRRNNDDLLRAQADFGMANAKLDGAKLAIGDEPHANAETQKELHDLQKESQELQEKLTEAKAKKEKSCKDMYDAFSRTTLTKPTLETAPACQEAALACITKRARYAYVFESNGHFIGDGFYHDPAELCERDHETVYNDLKHARDSGRPASDQKRHLFSEWHNAVVVYQKCKSANNGTVVDQDVDPPPQVSGGGQHRNIATGDNQSSECTVAQNAVPHAQAEFDKAFLLLKDASTDHQRLRQILDLVEDAKDSVDAAKAEAQRICNAPTKTATAMPPPPSVDGGGALPPTPVSPPQQGSPPAGPSSSGNSSTAMVTPPVAVITPPAFPAMQPPSYNSGSNVCNPTPPAPPNPANVCNPPTPASQPGNICNPSGNAPTAGVNSGQCNTNNGLTTCTDASGKSCTTTAGFCDPTAPQTTKTAAAPTPPTPNAAPLNLKPKTQMAIAAPNPSDQTNQSTSVPACSSKPPYLPWGGQGSATIIVSGGQPCGVGWHDTPGGPGGVTVLDSMSVSSPPSHGTLRPQDQHVIIFTPTPGYKGQDSFTLSMQEHNGGRHATLSVNVSVTIQ